MTQKPRRFRRGKSESDTESEPPRTSLTGSEDLSEEEIQRRRFAWEKGDLEVVYDPYADKGRKRRQRL